MGEQRFASFVPCCNQVSFMDKLLQNPTSSTLQLLMRIEEEGCKKFALPPAEHESCITQASESTSHDRRGAFGGGLTKVVEEERRKRKRRKNTSRKSERATESQRMSHIAVERNRRRLMNEHISALKSLMPTSYVQRGDQASVVGGAINYVKDLEQHLQTLEAEKQTRAPTGSFSSNVRHPFDGFFVSPQYRGASCPSSSRSSSEVKAEYDDGGGADIEATVVQAHVNLRVFAPRRHGQLLRAIAALEQLHLFVFHLNVASFHDSAFYSLNLKIEEGCKLVTGDEIATAVHHIFAKVR